MANKRDIKKQIKEATDRLIEDAYYQTLEADEKEVKKMESVIDELVEQRFDMLNRVSNYPQDANRAKVKEHFSGVLADLEKHTAEYSKKIGRVG